MTVQPASYAMKTIPGFCSSKPGIQVGSKLAPDATVEDMQFLRQMGVEWVTSWVADPADNTAEGYRALVQRFASEGFKVYRIQNPRAQNVPEIILGLPGRDEHIDEFLGYVRNLSEAGVYHVTYAHQANGIWRTGREQVRGGALHSAFRLDQAGSGSWGGQSWDGKYTHGRAYSEDELWDAYAHFIGRVVPVAEDAGVYIGVHPDDPPVYPLGAIPRCIFGTYAGFQRAVEMANSPNIGMSLCVGSWLEGGEAMGADAVQAIRTFGGMSKLFHIHFRNITAPLPEGFVETFPDDGYMNMYRIMRALQKVNFDGVIISDHLPEMIGGARAAEAHALGYMKALAQAAAFELGPH